MFKLTSNTFIRLGSSRLVRTPVQLVRFQSSIRFNDADLKHQKLSNDEKLDKWIQALKEYRDQTAANEARDHDFNSKFDIQDLYKPSEEQVRQYELLKDQPLPRLVDPTMERLTNIIMKNGKKLKARKIISELFHLVYLQTKQNPIDVFKQSVEKLAPIMKTVTIKTGFLKNITSPVPLTRRQRERIAIKWIVDGCDRRASNDYAVRLAEEILSAWEGKSADYEKRNSFHKSCVAHRAFLVLK